MVVRPIKGVCMNFTDKMSPRELSVCAGKIEKTAEFRRLTIGEDVYAPICLRAFVEEPNPARDALTGSQSSAFRDVSDIPTKALGAILSLHAITGFDFASIDCDNKFSTDDIESARETAAHLIFRDCANAV